MLTSVPKVYLRNRTPMGGCARWASKEMEKDEPKFGWATRRTSPGATGWIASCTECGRCDYFCPAKQTGKVLSPQHIVTGTREQIYLHTPLMLVRMAEAQRKALALVGAELAPPAASATASLEKRAEQAPPLLGYDDRTGDPIIDYRSIVLFEDGAPDMPEFVGTVHLDEALWACTTCGACDEHCPLFIEHVHPIVEMRRHLVLEKEGRYPAELNKTFTGLERQKQPVGPAGA